MAATRGTPLQGSRSAHDMTDADLHASDIEDAALTRHLPAPAADGNFARDNGTNWVAQSGLPLIDLNDYARGSIIRGGAADWESYPAKTLGAILIGDGTDIISTTTPTFVGAVTLPNTGLHLLDTDASHDLIIAPGSDLTADRTFTLTTGDADRTLDLGGNLTIGATTSITGGGTVALASYTLTVPKTGTVPVGTGTAGRIAEWVTDANTLQASTLIKSGAGVLTLSADGAYTLTVPESGTVALLATANVFTAAQTINTNSATAFKVEQNGVYDDVFVVDTTNGYVGVNTALPAAALDVTGDIRVSGTEVIVTDKNKHEIYLSDGADALFRRQTYRWYGAAWVATDGYGFGISAMEHNTGAHANGFGYNALHNNTGGYANGLGTYALYDNTGLNANGVGYAALQHNTGSSASGFGHTVLQNNTGANANGVGAYALQNNTGASANGVGVYALRNNTGVYVNGFGQSALQSNTGNDVSSFGHAALQNNMGSYTNGIGYIALFSNTGSFVNGFGYAALQNNTGGHANGVGAYALRYNQAADAIAIGDHAWSSFLTNAGGAITFDYTDVDAATDRITVTSHGFGSTGAYVNVQYTQGTSAITGLTDGTIYQVKIIDANTVGFYEADGPGGANRGTNITDAGTGTGHTLTPQYAYTSSIVIGHDTDPTKAYQVTLGASDIVETLLRGTVLVNTTTVGAQLAVDQSDTSGALPVLSLDQADVSEEFVRLIGESAADASQSLVDAADMTTPGTLTGWIKVYIEDVAASGAITDGYYYVPFYTAPST